MEEILGSIYCNNSEIFVIRLMKNMFKTIKAESHDLGVVMKEKKIGNLYGFSGGNYAGNVYEKNNLCPTINTCQGGGKQPMIIDNPKQLGFMDSGTGKHQSNTVYDEKGICPNITTIEGGGTQQIKIATADAIRKDNTICVAMRGRNPENPSDRTSGVHTEQCLEINQNETSNTLTSVQKDNLVMQTNNCIDIQYRIRKLTPRECWRLMDFKDYDFEKAQEVNSNTQLYKQAGNSIVKNVLVAIFGQMIDGKENVYKEVV